MSDTPMPPVDNVPAPADPTGPQSPPAPPPSSKKPRRRRSRLKSIIRLLTIPLLLLANLVLLIMLVALCVSPDGPLSTEVIDSGAGNQVIAVAEISGVISNRQVGLMDAFCRKVRADDNIKAVVLRVDSPGGAVSPCDRIYNLLKQVKESAGKPVVVSMGGVAASGGYYVSAPANEIYAEPTTVTGSIGVIGVWPVLKGTLDKIGMKIMVVRSTKARAWKASPSPFEETAPYQLAEVLKALDLIHERFEMIVRSERPNLTITTATNTYPDPNAPADDPDKTFEVVETVPFNGKVFLAEEALALGLVDKIGYFSDAVDAAKRLAGLTDPKVVRYSLKLGLMEKLAGQTNATKISLEALDAFQTPRLMMIWKVSP